MAAASNDPSQSLLFILHHPLRRRLLGLYIESEEPLSPKELSDYTRQPLSNVSYQVRALSEHGAVELVETQPRRGSVELAPARPRLRPRALHPHPEPGRHPPRPLAASRPLRLGRSGADLPRAPGADRRADPSGGGSAHRDRRAGVAAGSWPACDLRRRGPDRRAPPGRDRRPWALYLRRRARPPRRLRPDRGLLGPYPPPPPLAPWQSQAERSAPPGRPYSGARASTGARLSGQEARRGQVHQGGVPLPQTSPGAGRLPGAAGAEGRCCFSLNFWTYIPSNTVISQRCS